MKSGTFLAEKARRILISYTIFLMTNPEKRV
jgi:hypothetical protein